MYINFLGAKPTPIDCENREYYTLRYEEITEKQITEKQLYEIIPFVSGSLLKLYYHYNVEKDILTLSVTKEKNLVIDSIDSVYFPKNKDNDEEDYSRFIPNERHHNERGNCDYIINKYGEMIGLIIYDFFKRFHEHDDKIYIECEQRSRVDYDKFGYPRNYIESPMLRIEGWAVDILISFFTGKSWMPDYDYKNFYYLSKDALVDFKINNSVDYMFALIEKLRQRMVGYISLWEKSNLFLDVKYPEYLGLKFSRYWREEVK